MMAIRPIEQPKERAAPIDGRPVEKFDGWIRQCGSWSVLVAVTTWRPCEQFSPALPEFRSGSHRIRAPEADLCNNTPSGDW